ncbi:MAG: cation acetate symporter, partial [Pseudomonadota bacterium]
SLAAAGLFVPVVMGIWWKKTTNVAAVTGMLVGFFICLYYLVMTRYFPAEFEALWGVKLWFGITNISAAIFGLPVGFLITWGLSYFTEQPTQQMQDFVDSIRRPKGEVAWSKDAVHE